MKPTCYIIICVLFLMACNESRKAQPSTVVEDEKVEDSYYQEKADSVYQELLKRVKEEKKTIKEPSTRSASKTSRSRSSSSSRRKYKEPDNMRGFDPASEDDMDDNGMSRYMENDDERGWN